MPYFRECTSCYWDTSKVCLNVEVSSFQGVGIEEFHCIQRCAHFNLFQGQLYILDLHVRYATYPVLSAPNFNLSYCIEHTTGIESVSIFGSDSPSILVFLSHFAPSTNSPFTYTPTTQNNLQYYKLLVFYALLTIFRWSSVIFVFQYFVIKAQ